MRVFHIVPSNQICIYCGLHPFDKKPNCDSKLNPFARMGLKGWIRTIALSPFKPIYRQDFSDLCILILDWYQGGQQFKGKS